MIVELICPKEVYMRYRVTFLTGFAAGFVVGARAGRERYEQIKKLARQTADNPAVQQAAAAVQAKAAGLASNAAHKVAGQLHDGVARGKRSLACATGSPTGTLAGSTSSPPHATRPRAQAARQPTASQIGSSRVTGIAGVSEPGQVPRPCSGRPAQFQHTGIAASPRAFTYSSVCCVPRAASTAFAEYRSAGAALRHSPRGDRTPAQGTPSPALDR
jgi:predicted component of type VI protein secretion system